MKNRSSSNATSSRSKDIVVLWIISDSRCSECGEELGKGRFLRLEAKRPLSLSCADLAHLVFLASGNAALTRRAIRHSALHAVVVRFSRARKRYERQGVLVEEAALAQAEAECLSDADAREAARQRAAGKRIELEAAYVEALAPVGLDDRLRRKNLTRTPSNLQSAPIFAMRTRPTVGCSHRGLIGQTRVAKSPHKLNPCWRDGHLRDRVSGSEL